MRNLIPPFIHQQYENGCYSGEFEAVCMFVDISGFTRMTDELMLHGREGVEVLSDSLKYLFDPLVAVIYRYGGFITTYAGDAFTAVFEISAEPIATAQRALRAAQEIQGFFTHSKPYRSHFGDFTFGIKIGLGAGNIQWGIIGAQDAKTYYFCGPAVERCAQAEHYAEKGEAWGHKTFVALIANLLTASPQDDSNFFKIENPKDFAVPTVEIVLPSFLGEIAMKFVGAKEFRFPDGEFREAVTVFLAFEDMPDLDVFMNLIFELQARYGGSHPRLDFGDKGSNVLLFFGTPVAYENKEMRALQFISELRKAMPPSAQLRAGLTIGMLYTGFYGAELQQAFSCLGNTVNQAARFMVKARWGQVLTDERLAQNQRFEFDLLGSFAYKGRLQPIPTYELRDEAIRKRSSVYTATFHQTLGAKKGSGLLVGREAELERLDKALRPLRNSKFGGVVYVDGEAGLGKSRLIQEFKQRLFTDLRGQNCTERDQPFKWFYMPCDEVLRRSLNPVVYFLNDYFFQNATDSVAERKANFESRFNNLFQKTRLPELKRELKRTRSILGGLLHLHWEDSLFSQLDAKGRYENTLSAVKTLIKAESTQKPVIIELEDVHWIDADTRDFLRRLSRNVEDFPFLILAACRYHDDGTNVDLGVGEIPTDRIQLDQITKNSVRYLVTQLLKSGRKMRPVPDATLDFVYERSAGNPFFIEQISYYLQENELLDQKLNLVLAPSGEGPSFRVPSTINDVLVARIDRLALGLREIIKTASVLGQEFAIEILSSILLKTGGTNPETLNDYLLAGEKETIWEAVSEIRYIFKHALIREAVYEMQLKKQLRALHQLAAAAIEELFQSDLAPYYFELAEHYDKAQISEKAIHYFKLAGEAAQAAYQNQDAIRIFERLLGYPLPAEDELYCLEKKGGGLQFVGQWEQAVDIYADMLAKAEQYGDPAWIAKSANRLSWLVASRGNPEDALVLAERAFQISAETGDQRERIGALKNLGTAYGQLGQRAASRQAYTEMLALAEALDDLSAIVSASFQLREYLLAEGKLLETFEKYLQLAEDEGNLRQVGLILFFMGDIHLINQNFSAAEKYNRRMYEVVQQSGDQHGMCYAIGDRGIIYSEQGRFDEAIACYQEKLLIAKELGDGYNIWEGLINMGNDYVHLQAYDQAEITLDKAISIARKHALKNELCLALLDKAELYLTLAQIDQARPIHAEATQLAQQIGAESFLFQCDLQAARLAAAAGDAAGASVRLLQKLAKTKTEKDQAPIFYTLWKITGASEYQEQAVMLYQALYAQTNSYQYRARLDELKAG